MACLLKIPEHGAKGVVTFTTQEQRVINADSELQKLLVGLKANYVLGLHFNWHNHKFRPDTKFDFCMAGEGDLIPVVDTPYRLFPMDACNFTPAIYQPSRSEKFWDVLIVGNPVAFKRPEVVLRTIRELFDLAGKPLRVLYICPMPAYKASDRASVFYDIRAYYEGLFSREERNWFTLLTTEFSSPFPFDRQTLSVFFKNSRVFLHCALEERRCRIAAYAWCAGLPVVARDSVASILSPGLQSEPGYFRVDDDRQYAPQLLKALAAADTFQPDDMRRELSETHMVATLDASLRQVFEELGQEYKQGHLLDRNLDIRLGWHHQGIGGKANGLAQPLDAFMKMLAGLKREAVPAGLESMQYPERVLAGEADDMPPSGLAEVQRRARYLNPERLWRKVARAIISRLRPRKA